MRCLLVGGFCRKRRGALENFRLYLSVCVLFNHSFDLLASPVGVSGNSLFGDIGIFLQKQNALSLSQHLLFHRRSSSRLEGVFWSIRIQHALLRDNIRLGKKGFLPYSLPLDVVDNVFAAYLLAYRFSARFCGVRLCPSRIPPSAFLGKDFGHKA